MKLNFREAYRRQYRDVEPDERLLAEVRELMEQSAQSVRADGAAKTVRLKQKVPMFGRLCLGGAAVGLCVAVLAVPMLYPQVMQVIGNFGGEAADYGGYKVASTELPGELNNHTHAVWDEALGGNSGGDLGNNLSNNLNSNPESSQGENSQGEDWQNGNANSVDEQVTAADGVSDTDGGATNADERQNSGVLTAGYHRYDGYTVYDIYDGHDGLLNQPGLVVSVRNPRPIVKEAAGMTDDTEDPENSENPDTNAENPDMNTGDYYPVAVDGEGTATAAPHDVLLANRHFSGREFVGDVQPVADEAEDAGTSGKCNEMICEVELSELYATAEFGRILPKELPDGFVLERAALMLAAGDDSDGSDNAGDSDAGDSDNEKPDNAKDSDNEKDSDRVIGAVASWTNNADYITVKVRPAGEIDRQCRADILKPETWDQRYYIGQLSEGQPIAERWQLVPEELWYTMQCPVFAADEISADVLTGRLLAGEDAGHYYGCFAVIYDVDGGEQQLVAEYVVRVDDVSRVLAAVKSAK